MDPNTFYSNGFWDRVGAPVSSKVEFIDESPLLPNGFTSNLAQGRGRLQII